MPRYLRALMDRMDRDDDVADDDGPLRFIASTESPGRDGLVISQDGWRLDAYRANPVVLWAHRYDVPPIGAAEVEVEGDRLIASIRFDRADELARTVERKYRDGYLHAVSVGWDSRRVETPADPDGHRRVVEAELLDISAVPVPGDPQALILRQRQALADLSARLLSVLGEGDELGPAARGAIPPHETPAAPEDTPWDGPGEVASAPNDPDVLRRMHAWVDPDGDPAAKQSYKLPHHLASGEVVWRGVAAAMARLMQAGLDIPDADRRGVYRHLARHYAQFDRTPPEFRGITDLGILAPDQVGDPSLAEPVSGSRAGAVLSARNRDRIEQAISLLTEVLASAQPEPAADADAERILERLRDQIEAVATRAWRQR